MKVPILRILVVILVFSVILLADVGYTKSFFHSHQFQTPMQQSPFSLVSLKETLIEKISILWPGEDTVFMHFSSEVEELMNQARIQRKFVMTAA